MIMHRMMNCSIIGSDPILFDCCPAYGYRYCCYIHANEIYGDFWSTLLRMFRSEKIVTAFSYLITTEPYAACLSLLWIETT